MRYLALILPILLLTGLFFVGNRAPEELPAEAVPLAEAPLGTPHPKMVWISHDWVEVEPARDGESASALQRRETFGLDLASDPTACIDANCRACLIDLVYGREF